MGNGPARTIAGLVRALLASALSRRFVERPFIRCAKHRFAERGGAAAPASSPPTAG